MLSEDELIEARHKLAAGRVIAMRKMPYFSYALMAISPHERPGLGTFGVDKQWRLYYDPAMCLKWNVEEIAAVWLHEVGHLVRNHNERFASLNGYGHDQRKFNAAADAAINSDLRESKVILPDPDQRYYAEPNPFFPKWKKGMTAEQMYYIARGFGPDGQPPEDKPKKGQSNSEYTEPVGGEEEQEDPEDGQNEASGEPEEDEGENGGSSDYSDSESDSRDNEASSDGIGDESREDAEFSEEIESDEDIDPDDSNPSSADGESDGESDENDSEGEGNGIGEGEGQESESKDEDEDSGSDGSSSSGSQSDESNGDDEEIDSDSGSDSNSQPSGGNEQNDEDDSHLPDCGSAVDGESRDYEEPPDSEDPGVDNTAAEGIRRKTAEAIVDHANSNPGTVSAGLVREAKNILDPQTDWRDEFQSFIRRTTATFAGMQNYSYNRPSRRFGGTNIIMPSMRQPPAPEVAIVLDTSGSMDEKRELAAALGEMEELIYRIARNSVSGSIKIINCDSAAASVEIVRDLSDFTVIGGGGTDMRIGIDAAAKLKPKADIIMTITDGFTPWPTEIPLDNMKAKYIALIVGPEGTIIRNVPHWMYSIKVNVPDRRRRSW